MKCKYCKKIISDDFVDQICDFCWELKRRIESNYNNEAKKKILNELGWFHKNDPVREET